MTASKPKRVYKCADGKRVPGVTTIIGSNLGWSKHQLMHWAWAQGADGEDYQRVRDDAALAGTIAHALIKANICGEVPEDIPAPEDIRAKAQIAFDAYLSMKDSLGMNALHTELPLVSEQHRFGGTIDLIANVGGKLSVVDFKTSNDVYADHKIQLAAYGRLWAENHPSEPIQSYYIVRVGKDGSFGLHHWANLDPEWEAFLALLKLHGLRKAIE